MKQVLRRGAPLLLLLAVGVALAAWFDWRTVLSPQGLAARRGALDALVAEHPLLSAGGFVLAYVLSVLFVLPIATFLTLAGGLVFGWLLGGALAVFSATIGAVLLFLAARHAFGGLLRRHAGEGIRRFADGFSRDAFTYLLVLRLTPVFPFFVVNVAPAFFDVRLATFALATLIGIVPGTFVYSALGAGLDGALAAAAARGEAATLADLVTPQARAALLGLAALALLGLVLKALVLKPRRPAGPDASAP
ncbi:TVP38/TMEM64 family protein [Antarcticirhabdus aurantiaca]|uniref:VTT domain-containing protein n=1 Tax=Antarcticirhabdus aurantiaca TaxID=2606717 RepID=A0ACD4NPM0_9HYPH|nr:VTT domain-containing protein [Antarcticirhabdus aurantiaca]WAJ28812.1 VTT domain-containing protein [Jeongeuplla avenae]